MLSDNSFVETNELPSADMDERLKQLLPPVEESEKLL